MIHSTYFLFVLPLNYESNILGHILFLSPSLRVTLHPFLHFLYFHQVILSLYTYRSSFHQHMSSLLQKHFLPRLRNGFYLDWSAKIMYDVIESAPFSPWYTRWGKKIESRSFSRLVGRLTKGKPVTFHIVWDF